jgi:hypothetical protein
VNKVPEILYFLHSEAHRNQQVSEVRQEHRQLTSITERYFPEKIPDGKRKKCVVCSSFHEQFRKHEYNDDILIVKLDSVLKSALVDITPVLIMKNIIDTSS